MRPGASESSGASPGRPPNILVCFAVKEEANPFRKKIRGAIGIEVLVTGMGRRNTGLAIAKALARSRPDAVLTAGFAGGLRPGVKLGTVLFQTPPDTGLERVLIESGGQRGRIICGDRVASTAGEKRRLFAATNADAVEMESGVVMETCAREKIRAATVRVVLDTSEEDLPLDFNELMDAKQQLDYWKLARALLRSPRKGWSLIRLQKRSARAAEALAEVLAGVCREFSQNGTGQRVGKCNFTSF